MADLKDMQAALKAIQDLYPTMPRINFGDNISNWQQKYRQYIECENVIRNLPSVDAVEAVRCKDCKYCDTGIDEDGNHFLKCLGWAYGGTKEDDYCSHGERRTDGYDFQTGGD